MMASVSSQSNLLAALLQNSMKQMQGGAAGASKNGCGQAQSSQENAGSCGSQMEAAEDGFDSNPCSGSARGMQEGIGQAMGKFAQAAQMQAMAELAKALTASQGKKSGGCSQSASKSASQSGGCGGSGQNPLAQNMLGGGGLSGKEGLGGAGGGMFEDMIAKFMFKIIKEQQEQIKKMMAKYKAMSAAGAAMGGGGGAAAGAAQESRQLLFEQLKNEMQKMQQMVQSLSNVLNTLHQGAMNAIRNIRA